jgi:hypothetical protein
MDGQEMAQLLGRIGWPSSELARRLNIGVRSVAGWLSGKRPVPDNVAEWLREVADNADRAPRLPRGW